MNVNQSNLGVQISLEKKGNFMSQGLLIVQRNVSLRGASQWTVGDSISIVNATFNSGENSTLIVCMVDCQGCCMRGSGTLIAKCPTISRNSFISKLTLDWDGRIISPQNPSYFQQCTITLTEILGANFIGHFAIQSSLVSAMQSVALVGTVILESSVVLFRSGNSLWKVNGTLVLAENCDVKGEALTFQAVSANSSLLIRQNIL
jgi:hypothetical protein